MTDTLFANAATLGQLRELTSDLPDDTPIAVVIRKAHDPDHFYETVVCEAEPSVNLTGRIVIELTAPEPRDFDG
jgi:hypothetical protein